MTMEKIQFEEWKTPFEEGDLSILDLHWENDSFFYQTRDRKVVRLERNLLNKEIELQVHIIDLSTEFVYEINFFKVNGFRLLDEHGLLEIWEARDRKGINLNATFKVRNHLWSKESPLTFFHGNSGEWSHLISTENECLEVVCIEAPTIRSLDQVWQKQ